MTKNEKLSMEALNRLSVESYKEADKIPLVIVLDNVRSGHNIGAVFRTSDAFRIKEIILCGITAQPPHKDIRKSALGATESVAWRHEAHTLDAVFKLKSEGYNVWAVEQASNSVSLYDFKADQRPVAIIMGHEVKGVSQEVVDACDGCIELPQFGTKHSLNVSVCAGIVIWELQKQLGNI